MSATPLTGIRAREFSDTVVGPPAGRVLAELGAEVIKVEPAPEGDHTCGLGDFGAGVFAAFNRNKRGLAMDLKRKEARQWSPGCSRPPMCFSRISAPARWSGSGAAMSSWPCSTRAWFTWR